MWSTPLGGQAQPPVPNAPQPRGSLLPDQELVQGPAAGHLHDQHKGLSLADSNEPHDVRVVQLVHDLCLPHHVVLVRLLRALFQHLDGHVDLLPAVTQGGAPPEPALAWTTHSLIPTGPASLPPTCVVAAVVCRLDLPVTQSSQPSPSPKRTGSVSPSPGPACIQ